MAEWLQQESQQIEMYSHDLEVMSSNPGGRVELGVCSTSAVSYTWTKKVTDRQVVRAGISVTWNALSWPGGHRFEPWLGQTWDV